MKRNPRVWITVRVHEPELVVASRLQDIARKFPAEILQVFVPTNDDKPTIEGCVFLLVKELSPACSNAIASTQGVDSRWIRRNQRLGTTPKLGAATCLSEGQLIEVLLGPLRGYTGYVEAFTESHITVALYLFGRMVKARFCYGEIQAYGESRGLCS